MAKWSPNQIEKKLGIAGNVFSFIKKILTDRTLQVKVGSALSQKYLIENGTAQINNLSAFVFNNDK